MKILVGDILQSKAQTLINTVNCVGIMGKGIALEFKKRFPDMYDDYVKRCEKKEVKLGQPYLFKGLLNPKIINFPTKDHWKSISRISDIEKGLQYLVSHYKEWGITSLAIPPLGCGNGQLEWRVVGPLIYKYVKQMTIPGELYAPYGTNPKQLNADFLEKVTNVEAHHRAISALPALQPAWIALIEIVHRIEEQPYHWRIGRTIFQKIAYVSTREGLPTGFKFEAKSFGPFCKELKNAETILVNNNLLQEKQRGSMFMVKVGPNYTRVRKNYDSYLSQWAPTIEKITDLFMRLNTAQAEIVATVIYTADALKKKQKNVPSEIDVLDAVMKWKLNHKPPLNKVDIASAIRNLGMLGWLDVKPDSNLPVPSDEYAVA
ncbi:MAG: macro domain-containing protein [Planctomycetota bacterium]